LLGPTLIEDFTLSYVSGYEKPNLGLRTTVITHKKIRVEVVKGGEYGRNFFFEIDSKTNQLPVKFGSLIEFVDSWKKENKGLAYPFKIENADAQNVFLGTIDSQSEKEGKPGKVLLKSLKYQPLFYWSEMDNRYKSLKIEAKSELVRTEKEEKDENFVSTEEEHIEQLNSEITKALKIKIELNIGVEKLVKGGYY